MPNTAPSTAAATSTSGNSTIAFFPPSSSVTVFTRPLSAAPRWIARPVRTLPVKASRRTSGCLTSASPAAAHRR